MTEYAIQEEIENALSDKLLKKLSASGKIETKNGKEYFAKMGIKSPTYQCEYNGLLELKKAEAIAVVTPIYAGERCIITEYIDEGEAGDNFFEKFGTQLAQMHKYKAEYYGFREDNFIGANQQENIAVGVEKNTWTEFYFNKRLLYQYKLAEELGNASPTMAKGMLKLENKIESILEGSEEKASLLHGDLWAGNLVSNTEQLAVLIDPAVYYGHRESDLAMTRMFGGFPPIFYEAYIKEYPLKQAWEYRENIYKLYHVLNHLNLFGTSYLDEAERIIETYTN